MVTHSPIRKVLEPFLPVMDVPFMMYHLPPILEIPVHIDALSEQALRAAALSAYTFLDILESSW